MFGKSLIGRSVEEKRCKLPHLFHYYEKLMLKNDTNPLKILISSHCYLLSAIIDSNWSIRYLRNVSIVLLLRAVLAPNDLPKHLKVPEFHPSIITDNQCACNAVASISYDLLS